MVTFSPFFVHQNLHHCKLCSIERIDWVVLMKSR